MTIWHNRRGRIALSGLAVVALAAVAFTLLSGGGKPHDALLTETVSRGDIEKRFSLPALLSPRCRSASVPVLTVSCRSSTSDRATG